MYSTISAQENTKQTGNPQAWNRETYKIMCSMKEMKREWLFTTWDSHKEVIRFKIQAKGNTFPKQGIVKLCNLLSVVDAKYLNGFKRDYTNACRILLLVAIKKSNKSFDASRCFRSPSADGCQKLGGWHRMTLPSVAHRFPTVPWRQDTGARGLLGLSRVATLAEELWRQEVWQASL